MKLIVVRRVITPKSTAGDLYIDNVWRCYTLEDCDRFLEQGGEKVYGQTAIPRGTYKVEVSDSPRFGRRLPILLDVPRYTGVRIHCGNDADDTEGCILVGALQQPNFVGNSKAAFAMVFPLIDAAFRRGEDITLEVV